MSFIHYRIILKLLSPLHIGNRKSRNLMETREYVPGKTLWGALTARITRDYFGSNPKLYEKVGNFLNENIRFGYLWPSLDGEKPYFPWKYDDFDYLFKFGYMGQPIDYNQKATEEGELYEIEFIAPKTRHNKDVYLIGDLWVKELNYKSEIGIEKINFRKDDVILCLAKDEISLKKVFDSIRLGGETGYGWGRVKVKYFREDDNSKALGGIRAEIINDEVVLILEKGNHLTSHLLAADLSCQEFNFKILSENFIQGSIEPFTGYAYTKEGWNISHPFICFAPGSVVKIDIKVKVSVFGLYLFISKV